MNIRSQSIAAVGLWMALATPAVAHAGGWTQPREGYYVKAGYRAVPGIPEPVGFDATGENVPTGDYGDHAIQLYAEYGLTEWWTVLLSSTPVGYASYEGSGAVFSGPTLLGARRAINMGRVRTAVEVQLGGAPPVGDVDLAPEADVIWQPAEPTLIGRGTFQLGYGFGKNWLTAEAGFRWNSALANQVVGGFQVGRQWEHLVLDLHIPFAWSLTTLENPVNYMGTGETQYVGMGIGVGWWLNEHVGLMTGLESVVLARANAASLTLPIYVQLR